jgi:spermidine synthase
VNHQVLQDPRLKIHITDGRNFVLASRETFDVILSDSIHPRFSGNGSLYTYDYYRLLKKRLKPGGVVSMWLPFYGLTVENFKMIIKSFYQVFPNTSVWFVNSTLNTYVIVVGKEGDDRINFTQMEETMQLSKVQKDLAEIGAETPYKILDYFMFANADVAGFVGNVPLHTDNNMAVEYFSSRSLKDYVNTVANFNILVKHRTSVIPLLVGLEKSDTPVEEIIGQIKRYERATYLNLMGQYYFQVKQRKLAFQLFERIRQANPDDLEPVEYFGSTYQKPFLKKADLQF